MKRTGIHGAGMVSIGDMSNGAVGGAVAAPWWDPNGLGLCIWSAYQPKGAANLAASYADLCGNGNNTGPGVAPAWDAVNGWKFNGSTHYLTTTFVPQNDQTQTCLVQYTNQAGVNTYLWGQTDVGSGTFAYLPRTGGGSLRYYNGSVVATVNPLLAAGNSAVAGNQGYRNGIADGGLIGGWVGPTSNVVWIGGLNTGVLTAPCAAYVQAFALYDCTLTAPQVLAIAIAMAAL